MVHGDIYKVSSHAVWNSMFLIDFVFVRCVCFKYNEWKRGMIRSIRMNVDQGRRARVLMAIGESRMKALCCKIHARSCANWAVASLRLRGSPSRSRCDERWYWKIRRIKLSCDADALIWWMMSMILWLIRRMMLLLDADSPLLMNDANDRYDD